MDLPVVRLVLNKDQIITNIKNKSFELVDARGRERFLGLQPEARKELRSGNIEGSKNMPFNELINCPCSHFTLNITLLQKHLGDVEFFKCKIY